jgi:CheY-like chemotaxis protein
MVAALKLPAVRWSLVDAVVGGDDAAWRREVVAELLRRRARNAIGVATAEQAWTALAEQAARVLVLPAEPRAETIALVRRLRTPGATPCPHVQIVLLVANLDEEDVRAWVRLGVDYLCRWPILPVVLLERVEHLLAHPLKRISLPTYIGPDRRRGPATAFAGPNRRRPAPPRR